MARIKETSFRAGRRIIGAILVAKLRMTLVLWWVYAVVKAQICGFCVETESVGALAAPEEQCNSALTGVRADNSTDAVDHYAVQDIGCYF